jgi:hypothetical protein
MKMTAKTVTENAPELSITIDDVNRVLEVGRLLFSVLTPDEIEQLRQFLLERIAESESR